NYLHLLSKGEITQKSCEELQRVSWEYLGVTVSCYELHGSCWKLQRVAFEYFLSDFPFAVERVLSENSWCDEVNICSGKSKCQYRQHRQHLCQALRCNLVTRFALPIFFFAVMCFFHSERVDYVPYSTLTRSTDGVSFFVEIAFSLV